MLHAIWGSAKTAIIVTAVLFFFIGGAATAGLIQTFAVALGNGAGIVIKAIPTFVDGITDGQSFGPKADAEQGSDKTADEPATAPAGDN